MKILFDFRIYQIDPYRGIGRYIYNLVDHIIKNDKNNELDINIFLKKDVGNFPDFDKKYNTKYYFHEDLNTYKFKEKFDFWFFDDFLCYHYMQSIDTFFDDKYPEVLRNNCKKIVGIMHDIIPLVFSKNYLPNFLHSFYYINFRNIEVVDYLFTNSNFTKNEFISVLPNFKNKITNINAGVNSEKFKNIHNKKENHIIFIAGCDYRKNPQGIIEAFSIAYHSNKIPKDAKLYISCSITEDFKNYLLEIAKKNKIENQIIITGHISDEELIKLLSTAKANFFPSFYEGFGLPIVEAYACGTASFASNRSSTKELVLPECSFNPYDNNDIADKIITAYNDEELCKRSIAFGKKLIKEELNWNIISRKVIKKLKELNKNVARYYKKEIAVFGTLPPETTGLAPYNANTFGINEKYDVFSNFTSIKNFKYAQNFLSKSDYKNNFVPIELYEKLNGKYNYKKKIFVLGNSVHNITYLQQAINEKDKNNSWLYLHEAFIFGLIILFFNLNLDATINIIEKFYPQYLPKVKDFKNVQEIYEYCASNHIQGIIPILSLTNIKNIIVNSELCKKLILDEIKKYNFNIKLNIFVAFHPLISLESIKPINFKKNKNELIIGSFGNCNDKYKLTNIVIKAVKILNEKYNIATKLVLVGFNANEYLNSIDQNIRQNYIIAINAPEENELFSAMKGIDISVQLRHYNFGASSGCVSQLISLNKKIISTADIVSNDDFLKRVNIVKNDITPEDLAMKIFDIKNNKFPDNQNLVKKFSYKNLSNILLKI